MIKNTDEEIRINLFIKLSRRVCRSLAKFVFPNNLRVFLFKSSGVKINKDVTINEGLTLACDVGYEEKLIIEDRVAFGPNVTIIINSHPNYSKLNNLKDVYSFIDVTGKVHVKHDAWIGAGSIILPKITIGEFSIVGAGSVVTKDVPPFTIVAGAPAKIIKEIGKEYSEMLS